MPEEEESTEYSLMVKDPYYHKPVYERYRRILRKLAEHPSETIQAIELIEDRDTNEAMNQYHAVRQLVDWDFLVPLREEEIPEYQEYITLSHLRIGYRITSQAKRLWELGTNNISELSEAILILLRASYLSFPSEWFFYDLVMMLNQSGEKTLQAVEFLTSRKLVSGRIYKLEDGSIWQQSWIKITREGIWYLENLKNGGTSMTVINIDHSQIGVLNTGSIKDVEHIDINLTTLIQSGQKDVAEALKKLTEAVASNKDVSEEQQKDLLDQLDAVSGQAALPPEQRKKGIIKPILGGLAAGLGAVASLAKVWSMTGDVICGFFGVENPFKPSA
jgi:hypothetical protein